MSDLGDRQALATHQGAAFETTVETLLRVKGWEIIETKRRHPEVDVEIDIIAKHPETEKIWWIETKGSWEGERPGLKRTDTLKKALFNGAMLALTTDRKPYMIVSSHDPTQGSAGDVWLQKAKGIYVDEVWYLDFIEGPA